MSILVVGSVALDTIETPFGTAPNVLGGSASYFSIAASNFTEVNMVAVIGEDFDNGHLDLLRSKGVNISGIHKAPGSTFRWHGRYGYDLSDPESLSTELNVFEDFDPVIPKDLQNSEYVFLANIDPELQMSVLNQVKTPKLVVCDTMNFWIEGKPEQLKELLKQVNVLVVNDSETRELAQEPRIIKAAKKVLDMGPDILIVKKGENGALMFSQSGIFWAPSYPLEDIIDPTGAGDSFAGGFMGHLASTEELDDKAYKMAVIYGSVVASFTVEDFSVNRLRQIDIGEINKRFRTFLNLSKID